MRERERVRDYERDAEASKDSRTLTLLFIAPIRGITINSVIPRRYILQMRFACIKYE